MAETKESLDAAKAKNWRAVSAWVPELTEPVQEVGSVSPSPESAYISINDYNLLIVRANERARTNMYTGLLLGVVAGFIIKQMMKK